MQLTSQRVQVFVILIDTANCPLQKLYLYIPVKMAKIKTATPPKSHKDAQKVDDPYIVHRNEKWYSHSGKWLGIFFCCFFFNYATTIQFSNCTPRHLSQRNENLHSDKNLHANVFSKFSPTPTQKQPGII
jgi:hypothetical protein